LDLDEKAVQEKLNLMKADNVKEESIKHSRQNSNLSFVKPVANPLRKSPHNSNEE